MEWIYAAGLALLAVGVFYFLVVRKRRGGFPDRSQQDDGFDPEYPDGYDPDRGP